MFLFIVKSQTFLFDAPVHVAAHVRKDGTIVKPHVRVQKIAHHDASQQRTLFGDEPAKPAAAKRTRLDAWIDRKGGAAAVAQILGQLTPEQQEKILEEMGKLAGGKTAAEVRAMLPAVAKPAQADLFAESEKAPAAAAPAPAPAAPGLAEARALHREYVEEAISGASMVIQAQFERRVRHLAESLGPDAHEAREVLGRMFSGRYGNKPPEPKKIEGAAADRLQGDLARKLRDGKPDSDVIAAPKKPAPVPVSDVKADDAKIDRRLSNLANRRHDPTAPFGVAPGTSKQERRDINASVVRLVTSGATKFTDTERDLMRQYSGNGGCGDSLNEFYTLPEVAKAMWDVLGKMGIKSGDVLEPSCGAGVYLHTAPADIKVTGVELDPTSASVAKALHGDRHEIVNSSLERFATQSGGRRFKAVIGNVPFGLRGSMLKDDKRDLKTAEAYFVDTALDLTETGGVVALIVPTGLMDAKSQRKTRERLLRKGEFIGALRMPNTAFEHSHTGVTSDIVFFRKRPEDVAGALGTVDQATLKKLGVWDEEYLSGGYFEGRGAGSVLGTMEPGWRAKAGMGQDITVSGSMAGVPESIADWEPERSALADLSVQDIEEALGDDEKAIKKALGGAMVRPYANAKLGDTKVEDGITYVLQGDPPRWHRVDEIMEHEAVQAARPLAKEIDTLLAGSGAVDRPALEQAVLAYIARHGVPAKSKELLAAAAHDRVLHRLIGAVGHDGRLSDAVAGRTAKVVEGSLETAAATLAAERDNGAFTVADLAERSGKTEAEVSDALHASTAYAYMGGGNWSTMADYLTGELWPKLDAARAALEQPDLDAGAREKFKLQARRLEETIAPKSLEDVEIALNSAFLPTEVIAAWLQSKVDQYRADNPTSEYAKGLAAPTVTFEKGLYRISGGLWGNDLLDKYLNRTGVRKDDMHRVDSMNEEFRRWLLTSSYRDQVEDLYNRKFRGFVTRAWSQAPIDVPGLDTAMGQRLPNDYHWDSLRWALHAGKGIVADDVGLGKTVRGLMLARLAKMYGKAKRPTFVVPKSVLANWVAEAEMWFPGSRVLVIGETYTRDKDGKLKSKPDTKAERDRKYHELTQNDYDFVFISQPAYNDLDVDPITKGNYVNDDFWVQRGDALGNAGDKKLQRVREAHKQAVASREFEKRTDAIYFNDLGIDMMLVDEGHGYKNLYAARARFGESPKFLGGQGQSNRAFDMSFKAKWLREQNGGKGMYMLTATPTKNSPLEVYSMLSYIAPEEFEKIGIRNSEEFLDRYCVFKNEKILATNGSIEDALVTTGFKNLDELREIMDRFIMRRTAKDVGLKLPEAKDEMHLVDMSPEQSAVYGELRAMLAESGKKDATGDAHVFSIMDKMAKAAMDLELLDPKEHAGAKSPKYQALAKEVTARVKDGGQIVFCESVDSHEKIAKALAAAGIQRERIGIMNADEAESSAKRQNLADAFNSGALDVIIGNKTMEEGVNLQKRTSDIHHLDMPWNAAALQQRNGRGVRQGNKREAINIHTYLARGSFDGYRYQSMRAKKDWSDMLWNGGDRVENLAREGTFSREDLMVMMSADPDAERAKIAADKEAAIQRQTAEKRVEAAEQFVRFQDLKRSYGKLRDKNTQSANRLRMQLEKAKTSLASNPHFAAKGALDSNEEVLIHPATGDVVQRDMGMEIEELDGSKQRWVVTGVNPEDRTVSMRMYGDATGHRGVTVPLTKLEKGVAPFKFDKDAEAAEVRQKLEDQAKAQLEGIKSYGQVMKMPSTVLEANHDLIQRQLKDGAKSYKVQFDYGTIPMVNRETGAIEMVEHYEHAKKHDTHDYLLPTDAMRDKAIQSWMDARRDARLTTDSVTTGRRRGSYSGGNTTYVAKRWYKDAHFSQKHTNPFKQLLDKLSGDGSYGVDSRMAKEAKQRLQSEQMQRIRRAPSAMDAIHELMPLAKIGTEGSNGATKEHKATYPKDALLMAWARARHLGQLDETVDTRNGHSRYAYADGTGGSVHSALIRMARASGHNDLADAFADTAERHGLSKRDEDTLRAQAHGWAHTPRQLGHVKKLAERMGIHDKTLTQLEAQRLNLDGTPFAPRRTYSYMDNHNNQTFGKILAERMPKDQAA